MAFYLGARIASDIKRCQEERPRGHPADSRSGHLPIGRCDSPELTHSATAEVGDAKKSLSLSLQKHVTLESIAATTRKYR